MHRFAARALADHMPRGRLILEHSAFEVHVQNGIELFLGEHLGNAAANAPAGARDEGHFT
jgi:hypothetical protein